MPSSFGALSKEGFCSVDLNSFSLLVLLIWSTTFSWPTSISSSYGLLIPQLFSQRLMRFVFRSLFLIMITSSIYCVLVLAVSWQPYISKLCGERAASTCSLHFLPKFKKPLTTLKPKGNKWQKHKPPTDSLDIMAVFCSPCAVLTSWAEAIIILAKFNKDVFLPVVFFLYG